MDIRKAFPSKFLRAEDLQNREHELTISEVKEQEVGDDKQIKHVMYFQGKESGLVLNKTNATTIGEQLGWDTIEWQGKRITIFPTETDYGGKRVACIRVKLKQAPQDATNDDDIPF